MHLVIIVLSPVFTLYVRDTYPSSVKHPLFPLCVCFEIFPDNPFGVVILFNPLSSAKLPIFICYILPLSVLFHLYRDTLYSATKIAELRPNLCNSPSYQQLAYSSGWRLSMVNNVTSFTTFRVQIKIGNTRGKKTQSVVIPCGALLF